jgi:hypothetical protein
MLWIRKEKVFTIFNYGSAKQSCRELYFHGFCYDVHKEDLEATPPLFYHYSCLVVHLAMARLALDGAQEQLAA